MIVVCGELSGVGARGVSAWRIAASAAASGSAVQVVGVVGDDAAGDRFLLELAAARVGHAAVLREPLREIEAADLELALRYLPEVRVVVVVAMPTAVVATASDHAAWSGAALIVIEAAARGEAMAPGAPDGATVLEAPPVDPDGTFAGFVGAFAARLDGGATPADAWAATRRELAVDPV